MNTLTIEQFETVAFLIGLAIVAAAATTGFIACVVIEANTERRRRHFQFQETALAFEKGYIQAMDVKTVTKVTGYSWQKPAEAKKPKTQPA